MSLTETLQSAAGEVVDAVQGTPEDINILRAQLIQRTGLAESEITPEIIEKYSNFDENVRAQLDMLEVQTAATPTEKIRLLHSVLEAQEAETLSLQDSASSAAQGALETATTAVTQAAETGVQTATDGFFSNIDNKFRGALGGFGDIFKDFSIGNIIKKFLIGLFPASWGIKKLLGEEETVTPDEVSDEITSETDGGLDSTTQEETRETEVETEVNQDNEIRIIAESPEILSRQNTYSRLGNVFLRQISGEIMEENNSADLVYKLLENFSMKQIQDAFKVYNESMEQDSNNAESSFSTLSQSLDLDASASNDTILKVIETIAGRNASVLLNSKLSNDKLQEIYDSPKFLEKFGSGFVNSVKGKAIGELSLREASIMLIFSLPPFILSSLDAQGGYLVESTFGDSTLNEFEEDTRERVNTLIPQDVLALILSGDGGGVAIRNDSLFKQHVEYDTMDDTQKEAINKIMSFRTEFLQNLYSERTDYNLGMSDFSIQLESRLNYRNLMYMFTLLDGNGDISSVDDLNSGLIYLWVLKTLPNDGAYAVRMAARLNDEDTFTEVERSFIAKNFSRASNAFVRASLDTMGDLREGGREIIKSELAQITGIPESEIHDGILDYTEYAIILTLLGSNLAISKIPLPIHIKIILVTGMSSIGFSMLLSVLYEKGTFDKILNNRSDIPFTEQLEGILNNQYDLTLSGVVESNDNPF